MKQRREPSKSKREAKPQTEPEIPETETLEELVTYFEDQAEIHRQRLEQLKKQKNNGATSFALPEN